MKIVQRPLDARGGRGRRKLEAKVVLTAQGKRIHAPRLDVDSASFAEDLLDSFVRSVNRVRRENRERFGRSDGAPDDGGDSST